MPLTFEMASFVKFIVAEIFPGARLPSIEKVEERAHQDEAIAIQSEEVYERYMKYLTGCAKALRMGYIDVNQFTLEKQ
jgi:cyclopropane-fatty-acyl-phospholipid synthase